MVCVSELDQPALDGIILKSVREAESAGLAPIDASCDGLGNIFFWVPENSVGGVHCWGACGVFGGSWRGAEIPEG